VYQGQKVLVAGATDFPQDLAVNRINPQYLGAEMSNIKKDEEVKNDHGIEEDGQMKRDTAGEPDRLFEQKATHTSKPKCESNPRNSKHSTGPKTERGKNTSRLNSLKHGLTARTIPLQNLPYGGTQEKRDMEELANDLWSSLRPEGQAQALLVSRICQIYLHWNRLDRYQQAITTLAGEKELRIPTVELGDPVDVEELERDCANVIERCKEELASNESISAELMEALHPCVGPRRHYDLEQLRDEIYHPTSLGENIKEKNDGIDRRKEEFLAIVNSGVAVSLREAQLSRQIYDQVASARFDQYILPEEGDLRKILRYRSMLDRELSFCLDQLDRLKKIRIANPSSNL